MTTTWSPTDNTGNWALSSGNLVATTTAGGGEQIRAAPAVPASAKSYYELGSQNGSGAWGIANGVSFANTFDPGNLLSFWPNDGIYDTGGTKLANFPAGSGVIQIAIDTTAGLVWSRYGTGNWNGSGTANPATGVGGVPIPSGTVYLWIILYNSGEDQGPLNAGATAFTQTPPSGYTGPDAGGAAGRTADASITEAGDTLGAAAVLKLQAAASITEAGDTVSSAGLLKIRAASLITEAGDTVSASGGATSGIVASAAIIEASDTVSSAGLIKLQAAASITEAGDTVLAVALLKIKAAFAVTEAGDALFADARGPLPVIAGVLAITEAGDSLASAGTIFGWLPIPPETETWSPIPPNGEVWTPIAASAATWS